MGTLSLVLKDRTGSQTQATTQIHGDKHIGAITLCFLRKSGDGRVAASRSATGSYTAQTDCPAVLQLEEMNCGVSSLKMEVTGDSFSG